MPSLPDASLSATRRSRAFEWRLEALPRVGAVAALCAGLFFLPKLLPTPDAPLVGHEAPDFELALVANAAGTGRAMAPAVGSGSEGHTVGGDVLHLRELRGSAVILDFWATWCPPCRAQAPIVNDVARRWRDRGVVVVGVNTDAPDQGDPRAFAISRGLSYPIVRDSAGTAARAYAIEGLPTLVVVSRAGKVVAVRTGVTDDGEIETLLRLAL